MGVRAASKVARISPAVRASPPSPGLASMPPATNTWRRSAFSRRRAQRATSYRGGSIADCGAIAAGIRTADQDPMIAIDDDAMRMTSLLMPARPTIHDVASAFELGDGVPWKARFHVQRVPCLAQGEST